MGRDSFVDCIRATPTVEGRGRLNNVPGHFDMALIRVEDDKNNEATKGTFLEGMFMLTLRFILLTHFFCLAS